MKRIRRLFKRLRKEERCGFIAYVTCGDPNLETTVQVVQALEEAGADCIELGIPFSDPIADGPVIQAASWRSLQGGTTVGGCLGAAREIRERSQIPLVAFSYLNPIMRYGIDRFARDASEAGIDAALITDLPPESAGETRKALKRHGIGSIFLLAPTSSEARVRTVDRISDGFVYYVSTTGVTGVRRALDPSLLDRLDEIRGSLKSPVAVGFGVSEHEHYRELSSHCEAVVVGSAIVRAIGEGDEDGAPTRAGSVVKRILRGGE